MFKDECMRETNISSDLLKKFTEGDNSVEKQIGCYSDCLSIKLGFLQDDHTLNTNGVIEMLSTEIPREAVDEFVKNCAGKIGKNQCEITLNWIKCDASIAKKIFQ